MNELQVITHNNVEVVDSREVAKMVERNHKELLRDIRNYIEIMENGGERKIAPSDFFIEHSYINSQNKKQPCYLLTKKGCDMVAHKMTGEKGVLFTAAYVTAFEKMHEAIKTGKIKGMTEYQQMMAETRRKNSRIQSARILLQLAKQYEGTTYEQVLNANATKELTGEFLLPLPKLKAKTYSAEEIGAMLGISANRVGRLANEHDLKKPPYGEWFKDKAKHTNKEVTSFRYYEEVVPVLRSLLQKETA